MKNKEIKLNSRCNKCHKHMLKCECNKTKKKESIADDIIKSLNECLEWIRSEKELRTNKVGINKKDIFRRSK
jgi:hypothetical protein